MQLINRKIVSLVFILIIFFFIGRAIFREWDKISEHHWSPHPTWLIFSIIVALIAYLVSAYEWTLILKMIGGRIGWSKGISIFLFSIFGRYIPGGIWAALGRVYLCRLEGVPDSRSSMSILLEQAYPVISACLVFVISLLFWNDAGPLARMSPLLLTLPLLILFLHPKPFLRIINPVLRWYGKGPVNISLSFRNMLVLTGYYAFSWLIGGIAFYAFVRAFYQLELSSIPVIIGIYAFSFTAGYLAFLAPAGLGVREGILTVLLSLFIPTPIAIGVALLSRLWLVGVELIILLMLFLHLETRKMMKTALGW